MLGVVEDARAIQMYDALCDLSVFWLAQWKPFFKDPKMKMMATSRKQFEEDLELLFQRPMQGVPQVLTRRPSNFLEHFRSCIFSDEKVKVIATGTETIVLINDFDENISQYLKSDWYELSFLSFWVTQNVFWILSSSSLSVLKE